MYGHYIIWQITWN